MPIFTQKELSAIPNEPIEGLLYICSFFFGFDENNANSADDVDIKGYIEFYSLLRAYTNQMGFDYNLKAIPPNTPNIAGFVRNAFVSVQSGAKQVNQQKTSEFFEQAFTAHFRGTNQFELSDGDIEEIQKLTNDLRSRISQTLELEEKHKRRILSRLEAMQKEIHKVQSNFDMMTGTMCEVLSVIKKAGEAAEPWTRIVRTILNIVWASQGRVYELPSSVPMTFLSDSGESKN